MFRKYWEGACGNVYIREERLAELLGDVIGPIQITEKVASDIATALRASDERVEEQRLKRVRQRCIRSACHEKHEDTK